MGEHFAVFRPFFQQFREYEVEVKAGSRTDASINEELVGNDY